MVAFADPVAPVAAVPETVPIDEACRLLGGISRKTLYLLMQEGHIQGVNRARPGRRRYRRPTKESVLARAKAMLTTAIP